MGSSPCRDGQAPAVQQGTVQRGRSLVTNLQLAGERRLLDDAEDESEHVVEQAGDDAVGSPEPLLSVR